MNDAASLTIAQAAARLGISQKTLRRWANAGKVPASVLPSGHRRWTEEQIAAIIRDMEAGRWRR